MFRVIVIAFLLFSANASAQTVGPEKMGTKEWNTVINQTNFIIDNRCSGTLISLEHKLVLTNWHCVDRKIKSYKTEKVVDGEIKEIELERLLPVPVSQKRYGRVPDQPGVNEVGEATYQTEIVAHRQKMDLALLRILADDIPHSTYSQVLPEAMQVERGDAAYHVGNPAMLDATMTKGIISSVTRAQRVPWAEGERVPFIQYDGGAFPGSSGGAIYNDRGYLLGNVTSGFDSSFVFALHPDLVRKFLYETCWPVYLGAELKVKGEVGDWYCKDWGKRDVVKKDE